MMHKGALVPGCAALLLTFSASRASIVFRSFPEIAAQADRIVFGEVASVEEFAGGKKLAKLLVLETWRGPEAKELIVDVTSTFACDESTAVPGERAIMFLNSSADSNILRLAYYGRGRLPIKEFDGELYVERVWTIDLPEWMKFRVDVPGRNNDKGRVYDFDDIKRYLTSQ